MVIEPLTEPPQLSPKSLDQALRRRVLVTAVTVAFVNVFCIASLSPLYPDVARDLGMGADGLGLLMGISPLVSVLFQLPVGIAVDRFGARPAIALGLAFVTLAQLVRWL